MTAIYQSENLRRYAIDSGLNVWVQCRFSSVPRWSLTSAICRVPLSDSLKINGERVQFVGWQHKPCVSINSAGLMRVMRTSSEIFDVTHS